LKRSFRSLFQKTLCEALLFSLLAQKIKRAQRSPCDCHYNRRL
jgi:hypothetical protein